MPAAPPRRRGRGRRSTRVRRSSRRATSAGVRRSDRSTPNNQAPLVFTNLNTASLFFGVLCDIVVNPAVIGCTGGGTIHTVQAYMYSAAVTLSENSLPAVTNVAGTLWAGGLVGATVA